MTQDQLNRVTEFHQLGSVGVYLLSAPVEDNRSAIEKVLDVFPGARGVISHNGLARIWNGGTPISNVHFGYSAAWEDAWLRIESERQTQHKTLRAKFFPMGSSVQDVML